MELGSSALLPSLAELINSRKSWIWVLGIFKPSSSTGQRALHAENKYESTSIVASSGCFTGVSGTLGSVFLLVSLSLQLLSSV